MRELAHEPRLAAAGLGREQDEAALAALGPLEQRAQRRQLARAADERERRRRHERPGQRDRSAASSRAARELERRVLGQDLLLELPQRRARLEPELVERRPRVAVGLERLRLPARAVEREHQLPAQTLAVRMLGDQRLELADELRVAAEREIGLDPLLERRQPQILQPPGLDPRERLLGELGQRRPAPQRRAPRAAGSRAAPGSAPRASRDEPLEPQQVDRLRLDLEHVARRPRHAASPPAAACAAARRTPAAP